MKQVKRCFHPGLCLALISIAIPLPKAHAAFSEKLLSSNYIGYSLFPAGTPAISTGATYTWNSQGVYATNQSIIDTDGSGATADMFDGINGPDGNYSCNTTWGTGAKYGNLTYDLKSVYQISTVKVWADCTANSYMKTVEIHASIDGLSYNHIVTVTNPNSASAGYALVNCQISPLIHARYIKVIMVKDPAKNIMNLGEVAVLGDALEPQALLSNTYLWGSGTYNTSLPKIVTNATYQWSTEQPFVTEATLITSDGAETNDGTIPGGWPDLTDGSSTNGAGNVVCNSVYGSSAYGKYGTVVFNLNDMYQIGTIDVWTKSDSSHFMDGYEVQVSTDGYTYTSLGYTANQSSRSANALVNTVSSGQPGRNARFVKLILHNANDSRQLTVGEVAIWGWKLYDTLLPQTPAPEKVEVRTGLKNYSFIRLDWSSYNHSSNLADKYNLYVETSDFTSTVGKTSKASYATGSNGQVSKSANYFGLNPETTYYIAVTPWRNGVENTSVTTVKVTTPSVLGDSRIGNVFQINDPPFGAGNYVAHSDEDANRLIKLRLLRHLGGINKTRWHLDNDFITREYGGFGIAMHLFYHVGPAGDEGANVAGGNDRGVWSYSTYNEPDLGNEVAAGAAATAIQYSHDIVKAVNTKNLLIEPALSDTEPTGGYAWLNDFYNSDGQNGAVVKASFDVMDVHPYCKYADPAPIGLMAGAPEGLVRKIANLKDLMTSHGDGSKPIVFTELGWSTYSGGSSLKAVSRTTQRNYLARSYIISVANGIRAVWWYNFQDNGTTASDMEMNFGIIDWNGIPKPAYYGYHTLIQVLKDALYTSPVAGVSTPFYGYRFWDERRGRHITTLWAADETTKTAALATTGAAVTVISIDGGYKRLVVTEGTVSVPISGTPVFIYSDSAPTVISIY